MSDKARAELAALNSEVVRVEKSFAWALGHYKSGVCKEVSLWWKPGWVGVSSIGSNKIAWYSLPQLGANAGSNIHEAVKRAISAGLYTPSVVHDDPLPHPSDKWCLGEYEVIDCCEVLLWWRPGAVGLSSHDRPGMISWHSLPVAMDRAGPSVREAVRRAIAAGLIPTASVAIAAAGVRITVATLCELAAKLEETL